MSPIAQAAIRCRGTVLLTEESMQQQQRTLSIAQDAAAEARDHYRWLLLAGWFVLISTLFPFVIAMSPRVQPASEILVALAALAFLVYSVAIKRYWVVGLGLLIVLIAVMGWIVVR